MRRPGPPAEGLTTTPLEPVRTVTILGLIRRRNGRWQVRNPRSGRSWQPSRTLRWCCRLGLHFMAWDLMADQYRCDCRQQHLNAEDITV